MTIPSAAFQLLAEQTRRLYLPGANTDEVRRTIRKLALHFAGASLPESARRVAQANLALVSTEDPETYALRCLAVVARVVHEEREHVELLAKFDGLAESADRFAQAVAKLEGGRDGK